MKMLFSTLVFMQKTRGKELFQRALPSILVIAGLIIVTSMMIVATLVGAVINLHIALLNSNMSPPNALAIIGVVSLFIIALLITLIAWQIKRLRRMPQTLDGQSPLAACVAGLLTAFIAGLMAE